MPILMDYRRGKWCPTVFCDGCGEWIRDGSQANYRWLAWREDTGFQNRTPPLFFHWGCDNAHVYRDGEAYPWGRLAVFPTMLTSNLNLREKVVREAIRFVRWANSWRPA